MIDNLLLQANITELVPSNVILDDGKFTLKRGPILQTIGINLIKHILNVASSIIVKIGAIPSKVNEEIVFNAVEKRLKTQTVNLNELLTAIELELAEMRAYDLARTVLYSRGESYNGAGNEQLQVIRRNGSYVNWNSEKIAIATSKAFLELKVSTEPANQIAALVLKRFLDAGRNKAYVEEIQDVVQEELMKAGHYRVAEAYILYRAKRHSTRSSSVVKVQDNLFVLDNEQSVPFNDFELAERVKFSSVGLSLCFSQEEITKQLRGSLFDGIKIKDVKESLIMEAARFIEKDADFSKFAGRFLLSYIYEEVLNWNILDGPGKLQEAHRQAFPKYIADAIKIKRLHPDMLSYDLEKVALAIDPTADLEFDYLGIKTLYDRYLIVNRTKNVEVRMETPQFFWLRVAMGVHLGNNNQEKHALELYSMYKSRRFCSSTPSLFNSGTLKPQLSACYLYYIEDNLESILHRGIGENGMLSKWAGGLGGSWTQVRGNGGRIEGTNGVSNGLIPFLKIHNDQLVAVNQGGKRAGSGCAYLETWHNDIIDFLELRKNTGDDRRRCHDMNTANWIPDLFMERLESRSMWTLFRSNETPDLHDLYGKKFKTRYEEYEALVEQGLMNGERIPALELWKKMLGAIFETGHPWITFKDPCNVRSPQDHVGVVHSSNLCTEITLNTSTEETAVCNLGSIIIENHIKSDGNIDHNKLRETIRVAVRALDRVVDNNFYPVAPAEISNRRHRPIGLGVMGLANTLYRKGLGFTSEKALEFNDEFFEAYSYYAIEASADLAIELGSYSTFEGSKWHRGLLPIDTIALLEEERGTLIDVPKTSKMDWEALREKCKTGMRNSNVMAVAPTATISNIMGSSPCVEPYIENLFVKSNISGEFIILNSFLVKDLKQIGLWNENMIDSIKYFNGELTEITSIPQEIKDRYLTAFNISYKWIIDAAAIRQKWIDQSQSLNLWIKEPDMKTLSHMYRYAWAKGLKTTYYLRNKSASEIEKSTVSVKKEITSSTIRGDVAQPVSQPKACAIDNPECESCQ